MHLDSSGGGHTVVPTLPGSLFHEFLGGTVEISPPYVWYLVQVKVLVDFHDGTCTILSGPVWYVRGNQVENPVLCQFDDQSAPVMTDHVDSWLQESGEPRLVEDGNPALRVVNVAFSLFPLFNVRDVCGGEDHTVPVDLSHALLAVFMVFLDHNDVIP